MARDLNALRWDGSPGHYEVYYLSLTDRGSGVGVWIRYTMLAPLAASGAPAGCSLWLIAMDPASPGGAVARKASFPIDALTAAESPFGLTLAGAQLTERGMRGGFGDVAWDLRWEPSSGYEHVHPLLRRMGVAKTVLVLPQADLDVRGTITLPERTIELAGARGGQAHLWGSKHAARWCWAHCNDLEAEGGEPRAGDFLDGVSVYVSRLGREIGPSTPVVARLGGRDLRSTSPLAVVRTPSTVAPTGWQVTVRDGDRLAIVDVSARREDLVGVTYQDPDGDAAYCYNTETATMQIDVHRRERGRWKLVERLLAPRRAHFEYAQREPIPDLELHLR